MSKTIEIIVAPNGQSRIETKGFVGAECRSASQFVELALGQQSKEILKAEFYQSAAVQQQLREGQ